jgi:hypothetical protein
MKRRVDPLLHESAGIALPSRLFGRNILQVREEEHERNKEKERQIKTEGRNNKIKRNRVLHKFSQSPVMETEGFLLCF